MAFFDRLKFLPWQLRRDTDRKHGKHLFLFCKVGFELCRELIFSVHPDPRDGYLLIKMFFNTRSRALACAGVINVADVG